MDTYIVVDPHMLAFLANADFGPLLRKGVTPDEPPYVPIGTLQEHIPTVLQYGIATMQLVMKALSMYTKYHDLNYYGTRDLWRPDETIQIYLGAGIDAALERRGPDSQHNDVLTHSEDYFIASTYALSYQDLTPIDIVNSTDPAIQQDVLHERDVVIAGLNRLLESRYDPVEEKVYRDRLREERKRQAAERKAARALREANASYQRTA